MARLKGQCKSLKEEFQKSDPKSDLHKQLQRFLLRYRTTPHTTTGCSPAELLIGRRLSTAMDLLKPDVEKRVKRKQEGMMQRNGGREKSFQVMSWFSLRVLV